MRRAAEGWRSTDLWSRRRGGRSLTAAGVAFEIVPGITAALACAADTAIPLTHRDESRTVRFVTGHTKDWHARTGLRGARAFGRDIGGVYGRPHIAVARGRAGAPRLRSDHTGRRLGGARRHAPSAYPDGHFARTGDERTDLEHWQSWPSADWRSGRSSYRTYPRRLP